jgi:hypothetical protein
MVCIQGHLPHLCNSILHCSQSFPLEVLFISMLIFGRLSGKDKAKFL